MAKKDPQQNELTQEQPQPTLDPSLTEPSKAVTRPNPVGALALPTADYDLEDIGAGFEGITQEELAIPFIGILQKGSPEVEDGNAKQIPGTKPGMLINSVSHELYDGKVGIRVIPVHRAHSFIEWIPRDEGGGFVGIHQPNDPQVLAIRKATGGFGKMKIGDGNDLVETFSVFCIVLKDDGSFERVVISFSSSQIKHYKRWMTMAQSIQLAAPTADGEAQRIVTPPLFSHIYRMTTQFNQNKKGTWHGWSIAFDGPNAAACRLEQTHPLFQAAKGFRDIVVSGQAKAAYNTVEADATIEEDDTKF